MSAAEDDLPEIENLWRNYPREFRVGAAWRRAMIEGEVSEAIRRARHGHGHMTAVNLWVLVPQCMGCACSEARAAETSIPLPEVYGADVAEGYRRLGLSRRQVRAVWRALKDGTWHPRCYYWCGSSIDVIGEGFCVRRTDIAEYFDLDSHPGRKPPKWMKAAILHGFGGRCVGCKKRLIPETATCDHIVPASKGGLTEMTNLQPLCQTCNAAKGNQDVEAIDIVLTFPLCPPPSDSFEGVIW